MGQLSSKSIRLATASLLIAVSSLTPSCGGGGSGEEGGKNPVIQALTEKLGEKFTPEIRDKVRTSMQRIQPEMKQCHDAYIKDVADACGLPFEKVEELVPKGPKHEGPDELDKKLEGLAGKSLTPEQQQKVQAASQRRDGCMKPIRMKMIQDVATAAGVSQEEMQETLSKVGAGGRGKRGGLDSQTGTGPQDGLGRRGGMGGGSQEKRGGMRGQGGGGGGHNPMMQALMQKLGEKFTRELRGRVREVMQVSQAEMKICREAYGKELAEASGIAADRAREILPRPGQQGQGGQGQQLENPKELLKKLEGLAGKPLTPEQEQKVKEAMARRDRCAKPVHMKMIRDASAATGLTQEELQAMMPQSGGRGGQNGGPGGQNEGGENPVMQALVDKLGDKFTLERRGQVRTLMQQVQPEMKACLESFTKEVADSCGLPIEKVTELLPKPGGDVSTLGQQLLALLGKPFTPEQQQKFQGAMQRRGSCAKPIFQKMLQGIAAATGLAADEVEALFPHSTGGGGQAGAGQQPGGGRPGGPGR